MNDGFFNPTQLLTVREDSVLPKCGACGLYKTCKSPKMPPSGKGRRKVLIVAEAPGEEEDRQGKQLVGKSGQRLEQTLNKIGIDMRRDCYLTNAVICRPPNNEIKDNNVVGYCRPNLHKTLEDFNPESIILLGGVAVQSILPRAWGSRDYRNVSRWVGWSIPCQSLNTWLFPTYHPSYLLRMENEVLDVEFERHLRNAFAHQGRPWETVPDYRQNIEIVYDKKTVIDFMDGITDGIIAFDYETNRLKPDDKKESKIVSCAVCHNGTRTLSFPMPADSRSDTHASLAALLERKEVRKIAANMKFEDRWSTKVLLKNREVKVRGWYWDTMVAAHVLDCREDITGLKFQSFIRLGQYSYNNKVDAYLESTEKGGNSNNQIEKISWNDLLLYNGLDAYLEYLVADSQLREMGLDPIL